MQADVKKLFLFKLSHINLNFLLLGDNVLYQCAIYSLIAAVNHRINDGLG